VVLGGEKTERKNTRERWRGWRREDGRRGARVRSAGARRFYREDSDRRAVPSMHGVYVAPF
jgi:hypothetical protein